MIKFITEENKIMSFAEIHYSELANKLIKLFYLHILSPTLYNLNLKEKFNEDELKILIERFGEQFYKDFYSGLHYSQYNTLDSEYSLVEEKGSNYLSIMRRIEKIFYPNIIIDSELNILIIHLTNVKNNFFAKSNTEPTNFEQQKQIIEELLGNYCIKK